MNNKRLQAALYWHSQNIAIIPCYYRSKKPMVKWSEFKDRLPTIEQINKWFDRRCNLALITTDQFIILDFDCIQQYAEWYCWQSEHNPQVLDTYIVMTSRGLHLYYWLEQPLTEPVKGKGLPYEVKSHGKLITVPPSVHPSSTPYKALNSPDKILTVNDISQVLTFSPVKIKRPVIKNSDPWQIKQNGSGPMERVDLLRLFPEARQTDDEGHYWLTDCPIHGHSANFMLNIRDNVCYCYSGCGTFLATEIIQMIGDNNEPKTD